MTPATEKAAPIPAEDILGGFQPEPAIDTTIFVTSERVRFLVARATMPHSTAEDVERSIREAIEDTVRVIKRHLADREARPSLPGSREEREPTRFPAKAAYARAMDVADRLSERAYGTSMPDEWNEAYRDVQSAVARADRARARQGGNNG